MFRLHCILRLRSKQVLRTVPFCVRSLTSKPDLFNHLTSLSESLASTHRSKGYACLREPQSKSHLRPPDDQDHAELTEDFNDIDETVRNFGSPEFADHMSGHIFMQGTPIEDKSSKCVRIGDLIYKFDDNDLLHCVQCLTHWREHIEGSEILRGLILSVDKECCNRANRLDGSQLKEASFILCRLSHKLHCQLPFVVLSSLANGLKEAKDCELQDIVLFLLLLSFCDLHSPGSGRNHILGPGEWMSERVLENFDMLTYNELGACYEGLLFLKHDMVEQLKVKMMQRHGFRF